MLVINWEFFIDMLRKKAKNEQMKSVNNKKG